METLDAGDRVDDFLCQAVTEIFVLRIEAHVCEWQYGNGRQSTLDGSLTLHVPAPLSLLPSSGYDVTNALRGIASRCSRAPAGACKAWRFIAQEHGQQGSVRSYLRLNARLPENISYKTAPKLNVSDRVSKRLLPRLVRATCRQQCRRLLRRAVRVTSRSASICFGEAEVEHFRTPLRQHDVGRLQVAMNDAERDAPRSSAVGDFQRVQRAPASTAAGPALQTGGERLAFEVLHGRESRGHPGARCRTAHRCADD